MSNSEFHGFSVPSLDEISIYFIILAMCIMIIVMYLMVLGTICCYINCGEEKAFMRGYEEEKGDKGDYEI